MTHIEPTRLAFTIPDACTAIGVRRTSLYKLIAEGQIEARRVAGRTVIPAASLRTFMEGLPAAPIAQKTRAT